MTYYTLAFNTDNGGRRQFRIKNVTPGMPQADMMEAVDAMIAHSIMHPTRGALERLNSLTATTTSITQLI
jgi:hypothetical protein